MHPSEHGDHVVVAPAHHPEVGGIGRGAGNAKGHHSRRLAAQRPHRPGELVITDNVELAFASADFTLAEPAPPPTPQPARLGKRAGGRAAVGVTRFGRQWLNRAGPRKAQAHH